MLRKDLVEQRLNLPDRLQRSDLLQRVMRIWLVGRSDVVIGAYWPIKGEFDPLPALHRWKEDGELLDEPQPRRIGLPVVDRVHKTLTFSAWYPGCPMEEDAFDIPKPKETEIVVPTLLFVPCVGYGPGGYRLGYGGGFYDRTLATLQPRPFTVGLGFSNGFVPDSSPSRTTCRWTPSSTTTAWSGRFPEAAGPPCQARAAAEPALPGRWLRPLEGGMGRPTRSEAAQTGVGPCQSMLSTVSGSGTSPMVRRVSLLCCTSHSQNAAISGRCRLRGPTVIQ